MEESEIRETTVSDSGVRRVDPPVTSTRVTELRPTYNHRAEQAIWFVVGVVDALQLYLGRSSVTRVDVKGGSTRPTPESETVVSRISLSSIHIG